MANCGSRVRLPLVRLQLAQISQRHISLLECVLESKIENRGEIELAVKIIALTNYLSARGGGIPPAMLRLYAFLAGRGVEIVLAAGDAPDQAQPTKVIIYRTLGPKAFGFSSELVNILDRERPDLVHLHGLWTYGSIAARIWKRRTRHPLVVSTHGMVDPWALRQGALKKWIAGTAYEWANLRDASCIHALTEGEVKALNDRGFRNNVVKIPNGVDLPKITYSGQSSKKILLYLGRLHPKKGIAETLAAWSLFQKELAIRPARWQLVIAGWDDGGHLDQLRELVRKYDIEEYVKFVGPVFGRTKDSLYASADATILASYSEGLPMTILETWAFGKPAFITEHCNLPEGFKTGAAFKITSEPENIAAALIATLPDRARLTSAGEAARALAESSFNWAKVSETWFSLYSSLVRCRNRKSAVRPVFDDV
jgi:glycosyltransferase involved in cell wall biosynthesis